MQRSCFLRKLKKFYPGEEIHLAEKKIKYKRFSKSQKKQKNKLKGVPKVSVYVSFYHMSVIFYPIFVLID